MGVTMSSTANLTAGSAPRRRRDLPVAIVVIARAPAPLETTATTLFEEQVLMALLTLGVCFVTACAAAAPGSQCLERGSLMMMMTVARSSGST